MATLPPDLFLYDTLRNRLEKFQPRDADTVRMYVCGPTVYGPVHVGNARPAVVFDLLYRLLKRRYGRVRYARNITDIDDKIIQIADETGVAPAEVAHRWRQVYADEMHRLGVSPPDAEPAATDYIPQMLALIEKLLSGGFAYVAEGHVLFHVPSFPDYGALSNRRREEMLAGARVEVAPYKRDAADFVLWKPSPAPLPGWESPWGRGRPGWHIECSAMAASCLGEEIDIHGGGQDLIFPHHENELAQSRCAHGTALFARYWLHNGHIRVDGEKMSKSLHNVRLLGDSLSRFAGETVRLALLTTHYRRPMNWTEELLTEAKATLDRWYRALDGETAAAESAPPAVEAALADDLNTPAALAALHSLANEVTHAYGDAAQKRGELAAGAGLLGLLGESPQRWFHAAPAAAAAAPDEAEIRQLIDARAQARARRDFAAADAVRDELAERGVMLEDAAAGTTWRFI